MHKTSSHKKSEQVKSKNVLSTYIGVCFAHAIVPLFFVKNK